MRNRRSIRINPWPAILCAWLSLFLFRGCATDAQAQVTREADRVTVSDSADAPEDGDDCDPRRDILWIDQEAGEHFYCSHDTDTWDVIPAGTASAAGTTYDVQMRAAGGALGVIERFTADATTEEVSIGFLDNEYRLKAWASAGAGTWASPYTGFEQAYKDALEDCIKVAWAANRFETELNPGCNIRVPAGIWKVGSSVFTDFQLPAANAISIPYGLTIQGAGPFNTIFIPDFDTPADDGDEDDRFWFHDECLATCIEDTGTHTGANDAATLTDSGGGWTIDEFIDGIVYNTTDGSFGTITDNDATTVTATLDGGTDDDWDNGDAYRINGTTVCQTNSDCTLDCGKDCGADLVALTVYRRHLIRPTFRDVGFFGRNQEIEDDADGFEACSYITEKTHGFRWWGGPTTGAHFQNVVFSMLDGWVQVFEGDNQASETSLQDVYFYKIKADDQAVIYINDAQSLNTRISGDAEVIYGNLIEVGPNNGGALTWNGGSIILTPECRTTAPGDDFADGFSAWLLTAIAADTDTEATNVSGTWFTFRDVRVELWSDADDGQYSGLVNTANPTPSYGEGWRITFDGGAMTHTAIDTQTPIWKIGQNTQVTHENWVWYEQRDVVDDDGDGYDEYGTIDFYGKTLYDRAGYVIFENSTLPLPRCDYGACDVTGESCTEVCDSSSSNVGARCFADSQCLGGLCDDDDDCGGTNTCNFATTGCDNESRHPFLHPSEMIQWGGECDGGADDGDLCMVDADCDGVGTCEQERVGATDYGRGIAECRNCSGTITGTQTRVRFAMDFRRGNTGIGNSGLQEMWANKKWVHMIHAEEWWPRYDSDTNLVSTVILPEGAIVTDIKCYRPTYGGAADIINYEVGQCAWSDDTCVATGTVRGESTSHAAYLPFAINVEDQYIVCDSYLERTWRLWTEGTGSQLQKGGYCVLGYY